MQNKSAMAIGAWENMTTADCENIPIPEPPKNDISRHLVPVDGDGGRVARSSRWNYLADQIIPWVLRYGRDIICIAEANLDVNYPRRGFAVVIYGQLKRRRGWISQKSSAAGNIGPLHKSTMSDAASYKHRLSNMRCELKPSCPDEDPGIICQITVELNELLIKRCPFGAILNLLSGFPLTF